MGVIASPELTPSGNHVAMASPTRRPNAAPTKTAITQMIDACTHSQARPRPTRKIPLVCYLRVESVSSCRSQVHLYIPTWVKPIKVINHENNLLPIKKTGKKTPAGMGKATDTAVIINCNKKSQEKRKFIW